VTLLSCEPVLGGAARDPTDLPHRAPPVPYAAPGVVPAREVGRLLATYPGPPWDLPRQPRHGRAGHEQVQALQITEMADDGKWVLATALNVRALVPMAEALQVSAHQCTSSITTGSSLRQSPGL
jgi:hypothetical protein